MRPLTSLAALCALALSPFRAVAAQSPTPPPAVRDEAFVGGELEGYLRTLQTLGDVPLRPWSLRSFSPRGVHALAPADTLAHPWRAHFDVAGARPGTLDVRVLRPSVGTRYNSAFPWGLNDGAVWAGRGATAWASAGAAAGWGPASLVLAPIAFVAQNADFPLLDNARDGALRFGDGRFAEAVDYPQRFGATRYARLDPGESTLRVDYAGVAVGASTAHQWWGPSQRFPYVLGTNAPGFPHLFVGTSTPANLWIATLDARILWGQLDQSEYFRAGGPNAFLTRRRRFATGLTAAFQPRGFEQLEVGFARFIHAPWPDDGLATRYFTRSFEDIFKENLPELADSIPSDSRSRDGENQLASVFARFTLPSAGMEVYAEVGREDHLWNPRYLLLSYDEQNAVTFGLAKAWRRAGGARMTRLRAEALNFQQAQIDARRGSRPTYLHTSGTNQGHTQRGQLLGAGVGVSSAAGAFVGLDALAPDGRWTLEWMRIVRQDQDARDPTVTPERRALDVVHALTVERLLFRNGVDLLGGASAAYNFNRDFGRDRQNVSLYLSITGVR